MARTMIEELSVKISLDMREFSQRLGRIGQQFQDIGKRMAFGITLPLGVVSGSMIKTASDAQEMESAFRYTFGGMADSVAKWAEMTGDAMGRSTQEIEQGALSFQMLFKQAAPTEQMAADLSKKFATLTQDLSSFYNVSGEDALRKLRSGLQGEAEPMRDFGVFINEAAVAQKALEMGLVKTSGALTDQQKVLARAQIILEATADAQGDVLRTSGSFANQLRRLQAGWDELSVSLGSRLLPIANQLVEWAQMALAAFGQLSPATQDLGIVIAGLAAAAGPVLVAFGLMASGLAALMSPIALAVAGIAGLTAAIVAFHDDIVRVLKPIGEMWWTYIGEPADQALSFVVKKVAAVYSWLYEKLGALADFFGFEGISDKLEGFSSALDDFAQSEVRVVKDSVDAVTEYAAKTGTDAANIIRQKFEDVMGAFGSPTGAGAPSTPVVPDPKPVKKSMEELGDVAKKNKTAYESWLRSTSDGLARAVLHADSLGDALKNILMRLAESELSNFLFNKFTGGAGGSVLPGLGKLLGFADGGLPPVGVPSIVGERGPELFIPKVPGRIIPNRALSGMGGAPNVNVTISAPGADSGTLERMRVIAQQEIVPQAVALSLAQVRKAAIPRHS